MKRMMARLKLKIISYAHTYGYELIKLRFLADIEMKGKNFKLFEHIFLELPLKTFSTGL